MYIYILIHTGIRIGKKILKKKKLKDSHYLISRFIIKL